MPFVRRYSTALSMSPLVLLERLLAIHHAGAGALAQGGDVFGGDQPLFVNSLRGRGNAAGRVSGGV